MAAQWHEAGRCAAAGIALSLLLVAVAFTTTNERTVAVALTLAIATAGIAAIASGILALPAVIQSNAERRQRHQEAFEKRREVREGVRGFAAYLEDQHSFLEELTWPEQQTWILSRFDTAWPDWHERSNEFRQLRKSDYYETVKRDLGPRRARRLEELWDKTIRLLRYAKAFIGVEEREVELARISRSISQLKVNEAMLARGFAKRWTLEEPKDAPDEPCLPRPFCPGSTL